MNCITKWVSAAACGVTLLASTAAAMAWPDEPVHILVTAGGGGGADLAARLIGRKLSEKWGQPVIIDNKPGGNGLVVYQDVAHAKPDGYTLGWLVASFNVVPSMNKSLPYDPIADFAPISLVITQPAVLAVKDDFPVNSLKELIELAKSKPGELNYASSGIGSSQYLDMERLKLMAGIDLLNISFQGGAGPAIVSIMGGETQTLFQPVANLAEQIKAGTMKGLAVTGEERSALLPDVPTVFEASGLKGLEHGGSWYGITAPGGTPPEVVNKIRDDIAEVLKSDEVRQFGQQQAWTLVGSTPQEFGDFIKAEIPKAAELMKSFTPQ